MAQDLTTGGVFRFNDQNNGQRSIKEALKLLRDADELVAHNGIDFDIPALKKLYPGWAPKGRVTDTLVCARLIWPDRFDLVQRDGRLGLPPAIRGNQSLEAWGYRLKERKGDYGKHHEDADAWAVWTQEMEDYCVQDVKVTVRLHRLIESKKVDPRAIKLEHDFRQFISLQERHGFRFDVPEAQKLYVQLSKRRLELEGELQKVFPPRIETMKKPAYYVAGGKRFITKSGAKKAGFKDSAISSGPLATKEHPFNPGSNDQIAERLIEKYAWKPTKFTDTGKPQVTDTILSEMVYPEAKLLAEYLMVQKRIGQVAEGDQAWLKLERGGRIFGRVNTNGAVTGRCTHSNPNVAQVPAVHKGKKDGKSVVLLGGEGGYGWECRSLFLADEGHTLVGWDASGLELRCLAHFMGKYDGGAYGKILLEGDIHSENQKAAGLPTRDNAKTFIYAFLYGAGDAKIGSIVGGGAKQGKQLKEKFLRGLPALKRLKEAIAAAVENRGCLIGLDGRILHIRSAHAALNTLLQSAGALVMKKALAIQYEILTSKGYVWGKDFAFVANIHDEVQTSCRPEIAEEVGKAGVAAIRQAGDHFGFRCRLDGEYKIGPTWAATH